MTTTKRKTKLAQLILFSSTLIYGSSSITATSAPQLAKSKNIVVELTIGNLLADGKIEVPISTREAVSGGGIAGACSHCKKSSERYFYLLCVRQQKKDGVIVHLSLEATFADGKEISIEKNILVPRKNFVRQDFGNNVKIRAYLEGAVKSAANSNGNS